MDTIVTAYGVYLAISIALTVWVARTLFQNGQRFLLDVFHGDAELAVSVNHLLVVGFYLMNFAFVCLALRAQGEVAGARGAVEMLAGKVGVVLFVLASMHFFNLYVFSRLRRARGTTRMDA